MAFEELTQFLQAAADAGELLRFPEEADPIGEIASLSEQIGSKLAPNAPVILFETVTGSDVPVVTNLLGTLPRFLRVLKADTLTEVVDRLAQVLNPFPAGRDWTFGLAAGGAADKARFSPRVVRRGVCQQVIKLGKDLDLGEFPALHCWEGESNPAFTAAQVVVPTPEGRTVVESAPVEVLTQDSVQIHWQPGQRGHQLLLEAKAAHRQFPVAITLGGDPLFDYAAALPLPRFLDPWVFAGVLRNESVSLIRARTVEFDIPASAEIVLEGYIDPDPAPARGTLADRYGILQTRDDLAVLQLSAITHRANPICPAAVRSFRHQEDCVTSRLTEQLALKLLQLLQPGVRDLHLPQYGRFQAAIIVSVNQRVPGIARQVAQTLGGFPITTDGKLLVIVDEDTDVRDGEAIWREVCFHSRIETDSQGRTVMDATDRSSAPVRATAVRETEGLVLEKLEKLGFAPSTGAVLSEQEHPPQPEPAGRG